MVHYLYKKEDRKAYVRSCLRATSTGGFIVTIIIMLIGLILTIWKAWREFGYEYIYIWAIDVVIFLCGGISAIVDANKYFNRLFQYADENGNVEGSICVENDEFVVEETSEKFVERIGIEYIKGIRVCGKCIIIFCPAEPLYLPKTDELIAFLEPYKKR